VNQGTGNVEKNKTADPNDSQKYRQGKKRSESHYGPPFNTQPAKQCRTSRRAAARFSPATLDDPPATFVAEFRSGSHTHNLVITAKPLSRGKGRTFSEPDGSCELLEGRAWQEEIPEFAIRRREIA